MGIKSNVLPVVGKPRCILFDIVSASAESESRAPSAVAAEQRTSESESVRVVRSLRSLWLYAIGRIPKSVSPGSEVGITVARIAFPSLASR